jgi:hypothetical protein
MALLIDLVDVIDIHGWPSRTRNLKGLIERSPLIANIKVMIAIVTLEQESVESVLRIRITALSLCQDCVCPCEIVANATLVRSAFAFR